MQHVLFESKCILLTFCNFCVISDQGQQRSQVFLQEAALTRSVGDTVASFKCELAIYKQRLFQINLVNTLFMFIESEFSSAYG